MKRIPIKALKDLAKQYNLAHVILFAHEKDSDVHHIATYGQTVEQCSEAADFGNKLKEVMGWPESLQAQPNRVKKLEAKIKELENDCDDLAEDNSRLRQALSWK
jgi:uncharacterized protein Yka (UPF0111/DUF47 family)